LDHTENSPYLVLLDEILKGTNSVDKAEGSKQFLKKLNKGNATTLVATHDLSLCELSDDSQGIYNYFFEAVIESDELYFDYKLRSGICKNMNASYLLKKMNLVD
jgi:DNA mismatch repair ATPase MutS